MRASRYMHVQAGSLAVAAVTVAHLHVHSYWVRVSRVTHAPTVSPLMRRVAYLHISQWLSGGVCVMNSSLRHPLVQVYRWSWMSLRHWREGVGSHPRGRGEGEGGPCGRRGECETIVECVQVIQDPEGGS